MWKIEGLGPYLSEAGIGTADLYVEGQIFVGRRKSYNVSGDFDILINNDRQRSPIWILSGSTVEVGDSRGSLVVEEYQEE